MRRTRLRAAMLAIVAAALAGIGYQVARSMQGRRPATLRDLGADFLPEAAQRIRNFHRVKTEHGRTVWEITAEDARLFEQSGEVVVREPRMTFHLQDGERQARIAGAEGRLLLDGGRELRRITLRGKVVLQIDDIEVTTEEATYDRAHDRITAPGDVTVHGAAIAVRGRGMEVDVAPQLVRLLEDVETVLRSHAAS
jgi:LPS export ABC transporter protein LptC